MNHGARATAATAATAVVAVALSLPHPSVAASTTPRAAVSRTAAAALPDSPPVRLRIPRIDVDAPFTGLSLDERGGLEVPDKSNRNLAGWYKNGVTPGSPGNAIVLGHVDTKKGPAVFYRLASLRAGHEFSITRADGRVVTFRITELKSYAKDDFPGSTVYGDTPDPQIRLITCGGAYDSGAGGYQENVVAFASLSAVDGKPVPGGGADSG